MLVYQRIYPNSFMVCMKLYHDYHAISQKNGVVPLLLIHSPATSVYLVVPFPSSVVTAAHSFMTVISEDVIECH